MIFYKTGNLFDTHCYCIAHGCNAQGVMDFGVALQVKQNYSEAYTTYKRISNTNGLSVGDCLFINSNNKLIINAITQEFYGRDKIVYVSYRGIANSMHKIKNYLDKHNITEVAMPRIGGGLGGGDWNIIETIIKQELTDISVYVYTL